MWGGWEGFLQEVAPGLRPDSKKSHCSLMNCGSSSHEVSWTGTVVPNYRGNRLRDVGLGCDYSALLSLLTVTSLGVGTGGHRPV